MGFISDLPHELVAAFRATLEEVVEADLILHVRDVANPETDAQKADVEEVLKTILPELDQSRMIEVWNKIDLMEEDARDVLYARATTAPQANRPLPVSAVSGEGLDALLATVAQLVDAAGEEMDIVLDPHRGDVLAFLYQHGRVLDRHDGDDGRVHLRVKLSDQAYGRYEKLVSQS